MADPVIVECAACGVTVELPLVAPGRVAIEPLTNWTAPPTRCPRCSVLHERVGSEGGETDG